jgi:hypothetical protein
VPEDYAARPLNRAPKASNRSALQTPATVDVDSVPHGVAVFFAAAGVGFGQVQTAERR